jgi:hypothetical protein
MYEGASRRYCKNDVTIGQLRNNRVRDSLLICQGSNANSEATIYSPYVANKEMMMFLKIEFPNTLSTVTPSCCTFWIPSTAK